MPIAKIDPLGVQAKKVRMEGDLEVKLWKVSSLKLVFSFIRRLNENVFLCIVNRFGQGHSQAIG